MSSHPSGFKFGSNVVVRNRSYNRNMHQGQNNQRWKEPRGSDQPFWQQHLPQYHRQRPFHDAYQDDRYDGPPSYAYEPPLTRGFLPVKRFIETVVL